MPSALRSSVLLFTLAATTPAQIGTAPPRLENLWGNGSNTLPWAQTLHRWQQLYEGAALPPGLTTGKRLQQVGWRRAIPSAAFAAFTIDTEVGLYSVPFGQAGMAGTFATNRTAGTGGIAFTRKQVNLPARPVNVDPVQAHQLLPLDAPHTFTGPNLLAEVVNFDASVRSTGWRCDGCLGTAAGVATNFGAACGPTTNTMGSTSTGSPAYLPGTTITLTEAGGPASTLALAILGFSAVSSGGIPLPLDLIGAGAPGCAVYVSLSDLQVTLTSATGAASIAYPTPADAALAGQSVGFQWANIHPAANPFGVSFSAARRVTFGPIVCPMAYVYRLTDNLDTSGTVFQNRGQVMRLVYQ
jgi:hypothetical protein